jgi:hypothetical protein
MRATLRILFVAKETSVNLLPRVYFCSKMELLG